MSDQQAPQHFLDPEEIAAARDELRLLGEQAGIAARNAGVTLHPRIARIIGDSGKHAEAAVDRVSPPTRKTEE